MKTFTKRKKIVLIIVCAAVVVLIATVMASVLWFNSAIKSLQSGDCRKDSTPTGCEKGGQITIESGMAVSDIADMLEEKGIIKSSLAFQIYFKLHGGDKTIKAGRHTVYPTDSVAKIVEVVSSNSEVETFRLTFRPGETLANTKKTLLEAGYKEADIDTAFTAQYDHPVLADKPESADLEGYIYGETYEFYKDAPLKTIIWTVLDELYKVVQENDLVAKFQAQGLNLYQGIIMASIIQREGGDDLPGVASVFLNRLNAGMTLGSDVTYQYAADKLGVPRDPSLDNPYNTRVYPGLPPGPISAPGKRALLALAEPSDTNYLYFLSGDDDKTYFARTEAEHERNISDHCQQKCQIL
ncbi:MAG: endolytic transglycosylase MltG [Candidatus Nomurabacteria bacterium]|jgi:UPF0755 protein|nr:endolytic transglycosylase MltG [Candidatus Nomurabacteria bacterium]